MTEDYKDHKYFTFFMDIKYEDFDKVEGIVKEYSFPEWLIGMETSPRDHIHFLIFTTGNTKTAIFNRLVRTFSYLKHDSKKHGGKRNYGAVTKDLHTIGKFKRYLAKQGMIRGSEKQELLDLYIQDQEVKADQGAILIKQLLETMAELKNSLREYPEIELKKWIIKEIFKETNDDYTPSKQMVNKVALIFYRRYKSIDEFYSLLFDY